MEKRNPRWANKVRLIPEHPTKLPPEVRNVEFAVEWIDAERGQEYSTMETDRNVRELNTTMVSRYRRDMANGSFMFNGDPLCLVPSNGKQNRTPTKQRLANGNHRVHAAAGLTDPDQGYYSLVLTNMSTEAEETWDRNLKRTMGQVLRSRGEANPFTMASILRWACAYERYGVRWDLSRSTPADGEQEIYFENNIDDLRWANDMANRQRYGIDMHPSPFGFYLYITAVLTTREHAHQFWVDYVVNADMIPKNHPAQQLTSRLKSIRRANDDKKADYNMQTCLAFAAWNAWWQGDDAAKGPWKRLNVPHRWHSDNMPTLLPQPVRDHYDTTDKELPTTGGTMEYRVRVTYEDGIVVHNPQDEAAKALGDADNAIPPGYRPRDFEAIGQDVHIFRTATAAGDLQRLGRLELRCPNGRVITIEKT